MANLPNAGKWSAIGSFAETTVLLIACRGAAFADPAPTSAAATQPSDKWQYSLLNPTPCNELRDMDTDRPDKTNTPHTIDAGHLQIETGGFDYVYYRDKYQGANARAEALDLGQFNFRLGVLNDLEVNAVVDAYDFVRNTDYLGNQSSRQSGLGDLVVGGKLNFWGNDCGDDVWDSALGIQPQFKIPTVRENLGNGHPELFVGVPFLINLPADFHLGLQPTFSWESQFDEQRGRGRLAELGVDRSRLFLEFRHLPRILVAREHPEPSGSATDAGCRVHLSLERQRGAGHGGEFRPEQGVRYHRIGRGRERSVLGIADHLPHHA